MHDSVTSRRTVNRSSLGSFIVRNYHPQCEIVPRRRRLCQLVSESSDLRTRRGEHPPLTLVIERGRSARMACVMMRPIHLRIPKRQFQKVKCQWETHRMHNVNKPGECKGQEFLHYRRVPLDLKHVGRVEIPRHPAASKYLQATEQFRT